MPTVQRQLRMSPQTQPKCLWRANPTMVISPQGRRMPLEEAVNLVSYLSGPEKGSSPCTVPMYSVQQIWTERFYAACFIYLFCTERLSVRRLSAHRCLFQAQCFHRGNTQSIQSQAKIPVSKSVSRHPKSEAKLICEGCVNDALVAVLTRGKICRACYEDQQSSQYGFSNHNTVQHGLHPGR